MCFKRSELAMMKQYNPTYSPGVVARLDDPWRRILTAYRPAPPWARRYRSEMPVELRAA